MSEFRFKLYITGHTPRSDLAIYNLRQLCDTKLKGNYKLEIIDILENPEMAEHERILATPTLIKLSPAPYQRITGDLSNPDRLISGLDLDNYLHEF